MIKIHIDKAKAGMKVVKDIVNDAGMVIVPAGRELTDSLINKLSMIDIEYIYVEGEKELPPKEEVFKEIENRFKRIEDSNTLSIKMALIKHLEEMYK